MDLVEVKTEKEFNPLLARKNAPFTQAWFFGEWQTEAKREVRRFLIQEKDKLVAVIQAVRYSLPFGKSYIYIPYGPVLTKDLDEKTVVFLKKSLKQAFDDEKTIFIRLDFFPTVQEKSEKILKRHFKRSLISSYRGSYFQPRADRVIDLKNPENDIFLGMETKARYNIRLAEKKGVAVKIISKGFLNYFEDFYSLMKETSERDGFGLHPREYYENIFNSAEKYRNAFISLAFYRDELLAANFVLLYGETAFFLLGASSSYHRELMPSYLCQWRSIKAAAGFGFSYYSFGGISHKGLNKSWEGISIYKKKFGGFVKEYSAFYDLTVKPFWYYLYILRKAFSSR